MIRMTIKAARRGLGQTKYEKALKDLLRRRVLVGIPSDATQTPSGKKEPPPLWVIGYINELGDDALHIPPRPFLVPGVVSVKAQIVGQLRLAAANALAGDIDQADKHLHGVGLVAQAAVKERLIDGPFLPLKPSTIYHRQHRTKPPPNDRTSPLIDTRDMFNSIQYAVVVK